MVPILTFFNNKSGVGKTSLIYHLSWALAEQGKRVVIADLDPQANLTAAFLREDEIEIIWNDSSAGTTIHNCVKPFTVVGDLIKPILKQVSSNLYLIPGDVALSSFEYELSEAWSPSMGESNLYRPMRILSSFWQILQIGAAEAQADIILIDVGPNLGAINRAALIAADHVVIPLGADLFSLQGLKNLGPALRSWRNLWKKRLNNWHEYGDHKSYPNFALPTGAMNPIGYVCQQVGMRDSRPVLAYERWVKKIPYIYRESVLNETNIDLSINRDDDPYYLATIKHYRSLVPMAQEHNKPIFHLKSADGAFGSHAITVGDAKAAFYALTDKILNKIQMPTQL